MNDRAADAMAPAESGTSSDFELTDCPSPVPHSLCPAMGDVCPYTFADSGLSGVCLCQQYWACYPSCPASPPSGACAYAVATETTCDYPGIGTCTCTPEAAGDRWECGAVPGVCPAHPSPHEPCPGDPTGYNRCLYPVDGAAPVACTCALPIGDAGMAWICSSPACPATPPIGSCPAGASLSCTYSPNTVCTCEGGDAGATWLCNGKTAPGCPAMVPNMAPDCSSFPQGAVCDYGGTSFSSTSCVCGEQVNAQWSCTPGGG